MSLPRVKPWDKVTITGKDQDGNEHLGLKAVVATTVRTADKEAGAMEVWAMVPGVEDNRLWFDLEDVDEMEVRQ